MSSKSNRIDLQGVVTNSVTGTPTSDVSVVEGGFNELGADTIWHFPQGADTVASTDSTGRYAIYRFGALPSWQALQFSKTGYRTRQLRNARAAVLVQSSPNGNRRYRLDVELAPE
jgi:hypothetical protein